MRVHCSEADLAEDVGGEPLLSVRVLESLFPVDGSQLEHALLIPARQQAEDVSQVPRGLDVVELAAGQERDEGGVDLPAVVASEENPVSPSESLAAKLAFTEIIVQRQPSVFEESPERNTLIARIANGFGYWRLVQHQRSLLVAPGEKGVDNRLGLHSADMEALFGREGGTFSFDAKESANQAEGILGAVRIRLQRFELISAAMAPTTNLDYLTALEQMVINDVGIGDEIALVARKHLVHRSRVVARRVAEEDVSLGRGDDPEVTVAAPLFRLDENA